MEKLIKFTCECGNTLKISDASYQNTFVSFDECGYCNKKMRATKIEN